MFVRLFILSVILVCSIYGQDCKCKSPPPLLNKNQFIRRIMPDTSVEKRVFVPASKATITDCQVSLDCAFDDEYEEHRMIYLTAKGYSFSTNLNEMICDENSKWIGDGEKVIAVGCFNVNYLF